ncbi:MAG: hypothetical protein ACE5KU_01010 [Nitrososphaerales archaeon]
MRIRATRGRGGLWHVVAYVFIVGLETEGDVRLIVDTGCGTTTLSARDAQRLGIDYTSLPRAAEPGIGIAGIPIPCRQLPPSVFVFTDDREDTHAMSLDSMELFEPVVDEDGRIIDTPSLLGLDMLNRFSIHFDDNGLYLEC